MTPDQQREYHEEAERLALLPVADQRAIIAMHEADAENPKVPNEPTAHAEVVAIREACYHLKALSLADCEIHSSGTMSPLFGRNLLVTIRPPVMLSRPGS